MFSRWWCFQLATSLICILLVRNDHNVDLFTLSTNHLMPIALHQPLKSLSCCPWLQIKFFHKGSKGKSIKLGGGKTCELLCNESWRINTGTVDDSVTHSHIHALNHWCTSPTAGWWHHYEHCMDAPHSIATHLFYLHHSYEPGQFTLISMGLIRYACCHISGHHEPIPTKFGLWIFFIMLHRYMVSKTLKCKKKKKNCDVIASVLYYHASTLGVGRPIVRLITMLSLTYRQNM